ncbi:MAG: hypothetical protein HY898_16360 [Deltaproteobacteria bacterium]|nr:hypothetical protein [Deltaproteobacteria bacterium]
MNKLLVAALIPAALLTLASSASAQDKPSEVSQQPAAAPARVSSSRAVARNAGQPYVAMSFSVGQPQPDSATPAPHAAPSPRVEEDRGPDTVVPRGGLKLKHSMLYITPTMGGTTVQGNWGFQTGLRGGWMINRTFGIGLAGNGFNWTRADIGDTPQLTDRRIQGGYGGLLLEYVVASNKVVHGFIDTTIGGGGACIKMPGDEKDDCSSIRTFFVAEPTINAEVNVLPFMRLTVGAGYRFVAGPDAGGLASSDLSGVVTRVGLRFGQF